MPKKKLKLAIMGASGAGKSVFLSSYFKYKMQDDEGVLSIRINDHKSLDYISDAIDCLFTKRVMLSGTDKRYNLDFIVNELDTTVCLDDLPGGWTTQMESWDDKGKELATDLLSADGVIFFISVENLSKTEQYNKIVFKELSVFSAAMEHLRNPQDSKKYRADIPVCIIFTKGDLAENAELGDLEECIKGLIKNIKANSNIKAKWFRVGKNLRCWKSISMGHWESPNLPPSIHHHEYVVEPMDWLIESMAKVRKSFWKKYYSIAASILMVVFVSLFGTLSWMDYVNWQETKQKALKLVENQNISGVQSLLNKFQNREFMPLLLPSFLESGQDYTQFVNNLNVRIKKQEIAQLKQIEKENYKALKVYIDGVDWSQFPNSDENYYNNGVQALQVYLDRNDYYDVAPEHYEEIKRVIPYWKVCRYLRNQEFDSDQNLINSDDLFNSLRLALELISSIPDHWRAHVASKVHNDLNTWFSLGDNQETTEDISNLISQAEVIKNHPNFPVELMNSAKDKIINLNKVQAEKWEAFVQKVLNNVSTKEPGDAIASLNEVLTDPNIPQEVREDIENEISHYWDKRVDIWISEADDLPVKAAEKLLVDYIRVLKIPRDVQKKLDNRIAFFKDQIVKEEIDNLREIGSNSHGLAGIVSDLLPQIKEFRKKYPQNILDPENILRESTGESLKYELAKIEREFGNCLSIDDFECSRIIKDNRFHDLNLRLSKLDGYIDLTQTKQQISNIYDVLEHRLEKTEYQAARNNFKALEASSNPSEKQIRGVINSLITFLDYYPRSEKFSDVKEVKAFLETLIGGVRGTLIIVNGNFEYYGAWHKGNEMKLEVYRGDKDQPILVTKTAENYQPSWNESLDIRWTPRTQFRFRVVEEDWVTDDEIFNTPVLSNSIFGYKKLTGKVNGNGNWVYIKFNYQGIPDCPWG